MPLTGVTQRPDTRRIAPYKPPILLIVKDIQNIKEPEIILEDNRGQKDERLTEESLKLWGKELILELTSAPELKLRGNGKRRDSPSQEIHIWGRLHLRTPSTLNSKTAIEMPGFLFQKSAENLTAAELELGRKFYGRYSARLMNHEAIYGDQEAPVVEVLILLDWLQDFLNLSLGEQKSILKIFETGKLLHESQTEWLTILKEIQKRFPPLIDEEVVQRVAPFVLKSPSKAVRPPMPGEVITEQSGGEDPTLLPVNAWKAWEKMHTPDGDIQEYLDRTPPDKPALEKIRLLEEMKRNDPQVHAAFLGWLQTVGYWEEFSSDDEGSDIKKDSPVSRFRVEGLVKLEATFRQLATHTSLNKQTHGLLRNLFFTSFVDLARKRDDTLQKFPSFYILRRAIEEAKREEFRKQATVKRVAFEHSVESWAEWNLAEIEKRIGKVKEIKDPDERRKEFKNVRQFVFGVKRDLMELKRNELVQFHASYLDKVSAWDSGIDTVEVECLLIDERREEQYRRVLGVLETEANKKKLLILVLRQAVKNPNFNFSLFFRIRTQGQIEDQMQLNLLLKQASNLLLESELRRPQVLESLKKLYPLSPLIEKNPGEQMAPLLLDLSTRLTSAFGRLVQVNSPLLAELENDAVFFEDFLVQAIDKPFQDKAVKILAQAVQHNVEALEDKTKVPFSGEQFYRTLVLVIDTYEGRFEETPLCEYIHKELLDTGVEQFKLPYTKLTRQLKYSHDEGFKIDPDISLGKLFGVYTDLLIYEGNTELIPIVKTKVKDQLSLLVSEAMQPQAPGKIRQIFGWFTGGGTAPPDPEWAALETSILKGILYSIDRQYEDAAIQLMITIDGLIKKFKDGKGQKQRELEGVKIMGSKSAYEEWNKFYIQYADLREKFKGLLAMLKHIHHENQAGLAFESEQLTTKTLNELSRHLEKEEVRNFLREELPQIKRLTINRQEKEVRVFDFLDVGEGGKEGQFQISRYAFFDIPEIYDFMGYFFIEVPEVTKDGKFVVTKYVSKIAMNEFVASLYQKRMAGMFPDFKKNTERFRNNHLKEKAVNDFLRMFRQFLESQAAKARSEGDEATTQALEETLEIFYIPALNFSGNISHDPAKPVELLLVEYLPNLNAEIPKTTYALEAHRTHNVLPKVTSYESSVNGKIEELISQILNRQTRGQFDSLPKKRKEMERRKAIAKLEKIKALSVVINTVLRNVDLQNFLSGEKLVFLDMEGAFPHVFSSLFDMEAESDASFDPQKPVSTHFTWRLNNVFANEGGSFDPYRFLSVLMFQFLASNVWNCRNLSDGENKMVDRALSRAAQTLPQDVTYLIRNKGATYLNRRGDVIDRSQLESAAMAVAAAAGDTRKTASRIAQSAGRFHQSISVSRPKKGGGREVETVTFDPEKTEIVDLKPQKTVVDELDDIFGEMEKSSRDKDSGRHPTMRLPAVEATELDLMTEADFKTSVQNLRVEIPKEKMLKIYQGARKHNIDGQVELFGKIEGNRFVVIGVVPDEEFMRVVYKKAGVHDKLLKEAKERGLVYLGKWYIRRLNPERKVVLDPNLDLRRFRELPKKTQNRERLVLLVTDQHPQAEEPLFSTFGVPSEGKIPYSDKIDQGAFEQVFHHIPKGAAYYSEAPPAPPKPDSGRQQLVEASL